MMLQLLFSHCQPMEHTAHISPLSIFHVSKRYQPGWTQHSKHQRPGKHNAPFINSKLNCTSQLFTAYLSARIQSCRAPSSPSSLPQSMETCWIYFKSFCNCLPVIKANTFSGLIWSLRNSFGWRPGPVASCHSPACVFVQIPKLQIQTRTKRNLWYKLEFHNSVWWICSITALQISTLFWQTVKSNTDMIKRMAKCSNTSAHSRETTGQWLL